jgi:ATP-dependent RNA helicase DDX5/DBP2
MSYGSYSRGDDRYDDRSSYRGGYGGGDRHGGGGGGSRFGGGGGGGRGGGDSMGNLGAGLRSIQWDLSKLPVFEKNFYIEHPAVSQRSDSHAEEWRRSHSITVQGRGIPKPVLTFEEASMPEYVLKEVLKQGFQKRKFHSLFACSYSINILPFYNCIVGAMMYMKE